MTSRHAPEPQHAWRYVRLVRDTCDGAENQRRAINAWTKSQGIELVEVTDSGRTGGPGSEVPRNQED